MAIFSNFENKLIIALERLKTMTKIILAAPCMGKTTYAKNNPHIALDLESSDYFFDKTGFEHLSSEEFKGIPNRKRNPNGLEEYLNAIKEAVESQKYHLIFTSSHPPVAKGLIELGYDIHYVKPLPCKESENELIHRAKERGNNENWIQTTLPFVRKSPLDDFTSDELDHVHIHYTPPKAYLTDVIKDYGWHCPQVKTIENKTGVLMNQLKQTQQTYIKTLYDTGATKDYELAGLMEQVEELANTFDEMSQNTKLETNVISFYNDWMLDEIEVIKPDTLE